MKKVLVSLALFALLLTACSGSAGEVVVVTTMSESVTPASEPTAIPPTAIPAATPTETPDLRVIDASPRSVILTRQELPPEGRFYLIDESPTRNSEMISGWGTNEGALYLDQSGRVDGWEVTYARGTATTRVPEFLWFNAVVYKTTDGPIVTERVLGRCSEDWIELESPSLDETTTVLCVWREMQPNGKNLVSYMLDLSHRNFKIQMWVRGYEDSFDLEWLLTVAQIQLDKLFLLPLTDGVTYTP